MEIDFVNKVGNNIISYFTSESFSHLCHNILILLIIYTTILTISLIISIYYLYKKEGIKTYYAFIPFYNFYHFFKIIEIPYYLLFIPFINVIVMHLSGIRLAYTYRANKIDKALSIIIPIVMVPYMILSNKYELKKKVDNRFLKKVSDIDILEKHLENNEMNNNEYTDINNDTIIDNSYKSNVDKRIENIENNAIQDDVEEQLLMMESNKEVEKVDVMKTEEETIIDSAEIQDLFGDNDIRFNSIERIDAKVEEASNKNIIDNAEYKEYKEKEKDVSTIAFGGTSQNESIKNARTETKDVDMKCPHCGSLLTGSNGTCPGCGKDVSSIIYEKNNLTTVNI